MQERRQLILSVPDDSFLYAACACDTAARLCVRTVLCSSAFSWPRPFAPRAPPQPRPLCSLASLLLRAGPTSPSRSSSATASGLPDAVPATTGGDSDGDLPVPRWKASAHARVCDDAGLARILRSRHEPSRLLLDGKHQRPELVLRRSIPSLCLPYQRFACSLAAHAHNSGRCGSLRLHRDGLAPSTFRRSPGAPVHHINSRREKVQQKSAARAAYSITSSARACTDSEWLVRSSWRF